MHGVLNLRFVLLLVVVGLSGCGGCDSCDGNKAGTDAAVEPVETATVAPQASVKKDAEPPTDDESDAGKPKDAGGDGALRREDLLIASAVPRPKPPPGMPMGEFQSCGVYEGPLCERECKRGNCRQECDGVKCDLTCNAGYCSQVCGQTGKCLLACPGGHCTQLCTNPDDCVKTCAGGGCN